MKIITTASVFPPEMDPLDTIPRMAKLGFDGFDITLGYCAKEKFWGDNYLDWAKKLVETANALGVVLSHSHAAFDASGRGELVTRTMECAKIIGCQYMVVHPLFRKSEDSFYESVDEFVDVNAKAIAPIVEMAREYGITVLSENLLWGASLLPKAISDLVEAVDSSNFGWCFDTGHANALNVPMSALVGLKHVPQYLHVHDNIRDQFRDDHAFPGDGDIDWEAFMGILKTIGYKGVFGLEAHHQPQEAPDSERDGLLADLLVRARKMVNDFDNL